MARLTALIVLSMASGSARVYAQEIAPDSAATDRVVHKSKNPIAWVMKRLQDSNKQSDKPFNCSVIAGPFYDATSSFAIGGGVSGIYSWDRQDSVLQKSTLSAMVKASVRGMVSLDINGKNYMPRDRYRWNYKLKIANENLYYWGIGYDNGVDDANKGQYRQVKVHFHPDFLFRVARDFYVGPMADVKFTHAYHLRLTDNTPIQPSTLTANGVGAAILYDSRDFSLNAYRGQYLRIEQSIYPKLSNKYHFSSTDVTFCTYHGLWKSAVLAMEYHSLFTYGGEMPWNMLALVGDDNRRMRGYYEGRYRDRNIIEAQAELRQRLPKRFGLVVFGGAANVFHDFGQLDVRKTLPNYGLGLRWEFKQRVNLRLDCGFTKNKPGVVFNINEAF